MLNKSSKVFATICEFNMFYKQNNFKIDEFQVFFFVFISINEVFTIICVILFEFYIKSCILAK
jgi:hypothetical protein